MQRKRRPPSLPVQLFDLFMIEMTNWRWSWRSMVIVDTLGPLFSMVALGVFARDSGVTTLAYVLTGNLVLALMFGNLDKTCSHFSYMRFMGSLDYYATLPVHKYILILAAVLSFMLLSLSSFLVTVLGGALVLHLPLTPHPLLLLVIPLCAIPLSGIGALLGSVARNPQEAGSFSLLFTLLLAAIGPVIVPPDRLPGVLVAAGRLSPATYAAAALRQTLLGPVTGQILVDIVALSMVTILVFWLVVKLMDWRVS
jgi:ABC-2 type transport system permease protein